MDYRKHTEKVRILNIDILSIRKQELLERLMEGVVFTPNVDHLVRLQKDRNFYEAYQQAEWVVCDSVAKQAQKNINTRIGREIVAGAHSPSFQFVEDEAESEQLVRMVNDSGAMVLIVCATSPKQEVWIARYRQQMPNVRLFMALGATVDFEAGMVRRCPLWIQRLGMEWFWRFCQEPRRLFKRYWVSDMQFFRYFGKQLAGTYRNPFQVEN